MIILDTQLHTFPLIREIVLFNANLMTFNIYYGENIG